MRPSRKNYGSTRARTTAELEQPKDKGDPDDICLTSYKLLWPSRATCNKHEHTPDADMFMVLKARPFCKNVESPHEAPRGASIIFHGRRLREKSSKPDFEEF